MDTETLIDLALIKRDAAARYARKRRVLESRVVVKYFTHEELRMMKAEARDTLSTWRAARKLLNESIGE